MHCGNKIQSVNSIRILTLYTMYSIIVEMLIQCTAAVEMYDIHLVFNVIGNGWDNMDYNHVHTGYIGHVQSG